MIKIINVNGKKNEAIDLTYEVYFDDTIEHIKKKICEGIKNSKKDSWKSKLNSHEEIYLFAKTDMTLTTLGVYKKLSNNFKKEITMEKLELFCKNFSKLSEMKLTKKANYSYFDLLSLGFDLPQEVYFPLSVYSNNEGFTVNPFKENKFSGEFSVDTQMSKILLDFQNIKDNEIYCVFAHDLLSYYSEVQQHSEFISKVYYPYLYDKNIAKLSDLKKGSQVNCSDKYFVETQELLEFMKDNKLEKLSSEGISKIEFHIKPYILTNFPLDIIFNYLHCSKVYPYIKYNPGSKLENLIKLYAEKKTYENQKIPYLKKNEILMLKNVTGIGKKLSVLISSSNSNVNQLICEFDATGVIQVRLETKSAEQLSNVETILQNDLNKFLIKIKQYLEPHGYVMRVFETFEDSDVEIIEMNCRYSNQINSYEKLFKVQKCLSYIFNIRKPRNNSEMINYVFKRISNFKDLEPMELVIQEQLLRTNDIEEIVEVFVSNFPEYKDDEVGAREYVENIIEDLQLKIRKNENTKLRSVKHPGFPIIGTSNKLTKTLSISIEKINNIAYLKVLSSYIKFIYAICNDKIDIEKLEDMACPVEKPGQKDIIQIDDKNEKNEDDGEIEFEDDDDDEENDYMDLDFGEDSDIEDMEEQLGGGPEEYEGMSLNNPTPFFSKMIENDPKLFPIKKADGKLNAYSKSCPSNMKRQPVMLTDEEMKYIEENHPDSYYHAIKYGSEKGKQSYYICPRYWSFLHNSSISAKDLTEGKYGGLDAVIPLNTNGKPTKFIPKGKYIYEFNSQKEQHIDKNGNYVPQYPGFLDREKHPEKLGMPCCFKMAKDKETGEYKRNPEVLSRIKELTSKTKISEKEKKTPKVNIELGDYIIGVTRIKPLDNGKIGVLPIQIQYFLNFDNTTCYNASNQIKEDVPCLLRWGVEHNAKQSFICAITKIYNHVYSKKYTLQEMKNNIIELVDIDKFLNLHNGSLPQTFSTSNKPDKYRIKIIKKRDMRIVIRDENEIIEEDISERKKAMDITKLRKSLFYEKVGKYNMKFFEYVVTSYENFIDFLKSDVEFIDHTYLWDIVCVADPKLFKSGVNLIILDNPSTDSTNNVQILCPSNQYSKHTYESNKSTIILLKYYEYYEPVISFKLLSENDNKLINPIFDNSDLIPEEIKSTINSIKTNMFDKCNPLTMPSLPGSYNFVENNSLHTLIKQIISTFAIDEDDFKIVCFVINYDAKCVGIKINIKKNGFTGYLPCYPSNMNMQMNYEYKFIDDLLIWSDYGNTIKFLNYVKQENKHILCRPVIRIEDDGLIIGIYTETRQFIQINPPVVNNFEDDIPVFTSKNPNIIDRSIFELNQDTHHSFGKNVKLEEAFFSTFRLIIKKNLLQSKYKNRRQSIIDLLEGKVPYEQKIYEIAEIVKNISKDYVSFVEYPGQSMKHISKVFICDKNPAIFCDKRNRLRIPVKNLVTLNDNSTNYFVRIADELTRYNNLKEFILEPRGQIFLPNEKQTVNDDEILVLANDLNSGYFDTLTQKKITNPNIKKTADDIIPSYSKSYSNRVDLTKETEKLTDKTESSCGPIKLLGNNKLQFNFPTKTYIISYDDVPECGFNLINDLRSAIGLSKKTVVDIKSDLIKYYEDNDLMMNPKFVNLLKKTYLKKKLIKSFETTEVWMPLVKENEFYLSNIDLWILLEMYKIPSMFISNLPTGLIENKEIVLPLLFNENGEYSFILCSAIQKNRPNKYHVLSSKNDRNNVFFNIDSIASGTNDLVTLIMSSLSSHVEYSYVLRQGKKIPKKTARDGMLTIEKFIDMM